MKITKPIISILMMAMYMVCFGAFSIGVSFSDGTEIYYDGWLI